MDDQQEITGDLINKGFREATGMKPDLKNDKRRSGRNELSEYLFFMSLKSNSFQS